MVSPYSLSYIYIHTITYIYIYDIHMYVCIYIYTLTYSHESSLNQLIPWLVKGCSLVRLLSKAASGGRALWHWLHSEAEDEALECGENAMGC
jgi:hypothetical protein